jgi:hypothetical protein
VDRSAGVMKIVSGALFLMGSRVRPTLLGQCERLPRMMTFLVKHTGGVCGPAQEVYVAYVSVFLYRVYINLNRRDSRI